MKKSELIAKLADFNESAEIVFEIDGEIVDDPLIFANPKGEIINGELEQVPDFDCCVVKFH